MLSEKVDMEVRENNFKGGQLTTFIFLHIMGFQTYTYTEVIIYD